MKTHKTILTLLAVMLAVIGTTTTVVQADEPPQVVDDEAFLSYIEGEASEGRLTTAVTRYNALSGTGKVVFIEAWGQIRTQTPAEFLSDHTDWLVDTITAGDQASVSNQSFEYFQTDLYAIEGYSSALSAMWALNWELTAGVQADGESNEDSCEDCYSVTSAITAPNSSGTHWVKSHHRAMWPPGADKLKKKVIIP